MRLAVRADAGVDGPTLKLIAAIDGGCEEALGFFENVPHIPKIGQSGSTKVLSSALPTGIIVPTEGRSKETDLMEEGGDKSSR